MENLSVLTKPTLQMVSYPYSSSTNSTRRVRGESPTPLKRFICNPPRHAQELTVFQSSLANHGFLAVNMHNKLHHVEVGPRINCTPQTVPPRMTRLYIDSVPSIMKLQILLGPPKSIIFHFHNALAYWACAANRRKRSTIQFDCAHICNAVQATITFTVKTW